ncbi:hypothetical protein P8452_24906 [Trifolium repens]|nr:hypothetical protein P8452_24906 [Trifolium repens]
MGGSIYSFRNGPQQGHRSTMRPSCCDVKIQFIFITDPVHFISLGAKLLHRAAIAHIVLRWKIFFRFIASDFLANKQLPSCCDEMLIFFTFWAFSCLLASWTLS